MSPNATTIDLALVEKFLFDRKALMALDGAPFANVNEDASYEERSRMFGLDHAYLKQCTDFGFIDSDSHGLVLYIGTGDVCPAAEGWSARVLALARRIGKAGRIYYGANRVIVSTTNSIDSFIWIWHLNAPSTYEEVGGRYPSTIFPGEAPPTPAERLKAVLLYELTRESTSASQRE